MLKFINSFIPHVHCFSDKKHDWAMLNGKRMIIMACNKCGKEEAIIIEEEK